MADLQVTQLSELLAAVIELACKGFDLLMDDLVCTNIASLGKRLATNFATVWSLSSMSPLVCLRMLAGVLD